MVELLKRGPVWAIVLLAVLTFGSVSRAEASDVVASVEPPPTTVPAEPETTVPETTEAMTSDPDEDTAVTVATVVSLFAFALVLVVAGWWMVSRRDSDDEPHPRQPGVDEPLPGQDLV